MLKKRSKDGPGPKLYEATGVLHVHTDYSDGTGTTAEIANYASQRGLKWIVITDHYHLEAKDNGEEGKYSNTWALVGSELGDEDLPNHYLAYDIDEVPDQLNPVDYVADVQKAGGFGAIAHPHEKRSAFKDMPPFPWTAWDAKIDGVEIWNQLSQWVEGLKPGNRIKRFIHPLKSLTRPEPETLAVWDLMNMDRPVVGYVGVDAHALKYPLLWGLIKLKVFHYKVQFRSLLTHLLLEEPLEKNDLNRARTQIFTALRKGNHFGANHRVGNPKGFRFFCTVDGERHMPIKRIDPGKRVNFVANSPLNAEMRLMKNGQEIIRVVGKNLQYSTSESGVWRLETYRNGRGWVFTNPIRILPE
jgi:PHP domain